MKKIITLAICFLATTSFAQDKWATPERGYNENRFGVRDFDRVTPPPTPLINPANVISIFSDRYSNVPVKIWNGNILQEVPTTANNTKSYADIDNLRFDVGANLIDATAMQYLHFDIWTPDATTFGIKLMDYGKDGFPLGNDDLVHELVITPVAKGWNSYAIPLSDFTSLSARNRIGQLVVSSIPVGGEAYIANVYFSSETPDSPSNTSGFALYPNPAKSTLNITSGPIIETVVIYNTLGEPVLATDTKGSNITIDVSTLKQGIYTVASVTNNTVIATKLVKE